MSPPTMDEQQWPHHFINKYALTNWSLRSNKGDEASVIQLKLILYLLLYFARLNMSSHECQHIEVMKYGE